jgi:DNA ligase (NAD+)
MNTERITELSKKINQARQEYYNEQPTISDKVYDAWIDELKLLDPSHKAITAIGAPIISDEWKKAKHQMAMGSLDKVNTPEELKDWAKDKNCKNWFLTEKLDGLSIELIYEQGKLIEAITRGDGETGDAILANVARMAGVKSNLQQDFTGSLRGEIMMKLSVHQQFFSDKANARNGAAGLAKRLDGIGVDKLHIYFYQAIGDVEFKSEIEQFEWLTKQELTTPNFWSFDKLDDLIDHWRDYQDDQRDKLDYEVDGLVVRIDNLEQQTALGEKDLRPKGARAFKFDHASAITTLINVLWQIGNSGRITPVAVFEPIIVDGAELRQASLHNAARLNELQLYKGCSILVSRRNGVIPFVEERL